MGRGHHHVLTNLHDILRSVVEPDLAALERRNVEDVVQQREQHLGVADHDGAVLGALLLRKLLALHQRREAHDGVERRADFVAHVGQERRLEHVRLLGLLPGDDQLALALLKRELEPPHAQQQPRHEEQQQHQQQDARHQQFDVVGVFRQLGRHRILDDAALGQGVFGDFPLLELARIEQIETFARMEMSVFDVVRVVIFPDLVRNDLRAVLVFGHVTADRRVADARTGHREDRNAGVVLHQVVQRPLHEEFAVAAHTPRAEHHGRTGRQRRIGPERRLLPLAAVHQHEIQVGVVLPLRAHERLQRNAAVGIVGHQSDVLHLGIKRTDQVDVAPDVVAVEHAAHPVQAVAHRPVVDRTGSPRLQRIGRRGQHDAVLAGEAAEAHHPFGNAAQRYDRLPSVRKAARGR